MDALSLLTEQLWSPGSDEGLRVRTNRAVVPRDEDGWVTAEEYWIVPRTASPRLLIPVAPPAVQRAALTHYRGLRRPLPRLGRAAAGAMAATRAPLSPYRLLVRARDAATAAALPVSRLAAELQAPGITATFGVRTGANRKATLHLLSPDGASVGYAKLGWNRTANTYVETETKTLLQVGGGSGPMRAPAVLTSFVQGGRPVVVIAPLPTDVRGLRGAVAAPTSEELFALCPVAGHGRAAATAHVQAMQATLMHLSNSAETVSVLREAAELAALVAADPREMPRQVRWHGDLTPWNCARQPDGQLWAWDWESSTEDVVAGLDAVHWEFSLRREQGGLASLTLRDCLDAAAPHLAAAGVPHAARALVAAVYVLTVVERAGELAAREGSWARVWITPERLSTLVAEARHLLTAAG